MILDSYQRGVGMLSVEGRLVGHIASMVREMTFPSRQPWVWFVVVWLDGTKESAFEDYGPGWHTVAELDAGYLEHHAKSVTTENRLGGLRFSSSKPGAPTRFEVEWLAADIAARRWDELGLEDADF